MSVFTTRPLVCVQSSRFWVVLKHARSILSILWAHLPTVSPLSNHVKRIGNLLPRPVVRCYFWSHFIPSCRVLKSIKVFTTVIDSYFIQLCSAPDSGVNLSLSWTERTRTRSGSHRPIVSEWANQLKRELKRNNAFPLHIQYVFDWLRQTINWLHL